MLLRDASCELFEKSVDNSEISHAIPRRGLFRASRKPHDFNDLISNIERVAGELHAKLALKVITGQVSAQDVEEASVLHGGVCVF